MRYRWIACLLSVTALGISGGSTAAALLEEPAAAQTHRVRKVEIRQFEFQAPSLTVQAGETIVWINKDIVPHTVTDRDGAFDSGTLAPGASWKFVAKAAGTFHYECTLHPNMEGTLIVLGSAKGK